MKSKALLHRIGAPAIQDAGLADQVTERMGIRGKDPDPAAEGGRGAIEVTLDKKSVRLVLKRGLQSQGAEFDRFGLFTSTTGGQLVRLYLDDLTYTSGR